MLSASLNKTFPSFLHMSTSCAQGSLGLMSIQYFYIIIMSSKTSFNVSAYVRAYFTACACVLTKGVCVSMCVCVCVCVCVIYIYIYIYI